MKRLLLLPLLLAPGFLRADDAAAGLVGGSTVTLSAVDAAAADKLRRIRNDEFSARRTALDEVFFKELADREARARGVSTEEFLRAEVEGKIQVPTEQEKRGFYDDNKAAVSRPYEEVAKDIDDYMRQLRTTDRKGRLLRSLKAKYGVRSLLETPRVAVDPADGPALGPAKAPVLLLIFSDFECPHCSRSVETVKTLAAVYGKDLRVVYRQYPLVNIHPHAARAAEAAACAQAQGKFWPYHDLLFAHQQDLSDDNLKKLAREAGAKGAVFDACLASGKYFNAWKKDQADGQSYGVTGTPSFFVNGRMFFGNQSLEAFEQAVDDELIARGLPLPSVDSLEPPKGKKK